MGNRRFARVETSGEEDNELLPPPSRGLTGDDKLRKRKRVHFSDEEEEKEGTEEVELNEQREKRKKEQSEPEASSSEDDEDDGPDAQPIGDVVRVSGKGKSRRNHFESFEYDGLQYHLEDTVLLAPEQKYQKPYVAMIKDITQTWKGDMMVTGQWFYRPEEAEKKGGGNWKSRNTRELFYSFHRDEVEAESVMHNCVVHFVPLNKQIPHRKHHPGFIVQNVYDTELRRLLKLTDIDFGDNKQHEIDILVEKTFARIGGLSDLESGAAAVDHEDSMKNKHLLSKRDTEPLDVSEGHIELGRSLQSLKAEILRSTPACASEYFDCLSKFKVLTGESQRDRCLEKLLQSIQFTRTSNGCKQNDEKERDGSDVRSPCNESGFSNPSDESHDKTQNRNAVLARRLLNRELEPTRILNMSPNELKEGLTAEELASKEPEELGCMQMTDARCQRCEEKQVGSKEIIQAGHGQRYQLECNACGHTWYTSRYDASSPTVEGPSSAKTVLGSAMLEKNLTSPCGANDV